MFLQRQALPSPWTTSEHHPSNADSSASWSDLHKTLEWAFDWIFWLSRKQTDFPHSSIPASVAAMVSQSYKVLYIRISCIKAVSPVTGAISPTDIRFYHLKISIRFKEKKNENVEVTWTPATLSNMLSAQVLNTLVVLSVQRNVFFPPPPSFSSYAVGGLLITLSLLMQ